MHGTGMPMHGTPGSNNYSWYGSNNYSWYGSNNYSWYGVPMHSTPPMHGPGMRMRLITTRDWYANARPWCASARYATNARPW